VAVGVHQEAAAAAAAAAVNSVEWGITWLADCKCKDACTAAPAAAAAAAAAAAHRL
jgi:hypothetical protein